MIRMSCCLSTTAEVLFHSFRCFIHLLQDAEELTVDEFMAKVGKVLREADFPTKSKIVRKLSQLFTDRAIPQDAISAAIYSVLTGSEGTLSPDCTYSDHQQFVQAAMPLLFTIADHDKDFLVELMFAYTEGSQATRYVFFTHVVLTRYKPVLNLYAENSCILCVYLQLYM